MLKALLIAWTVQSNVNIQACEAYTVLDNGFGLFVVTQGDEWFFGINGYMVSPGNEYPTKFEFSTGETFGGDMVAVDGLSLIIRVKEDFLSHMSKSYWIEIDDQHQFSLDGSARAIDSVRECQAAMTKVVTTSGWGI